MQSLCSSKCKSHFILTFGVQISNIRAAKTYLRAGVFCARPVQVSSMSTFVIETSSHLEVNVYFVGEMRMPKRDCACSQSRFCMGSLPVFQGSNFKTRLKLFDIKMVSGSAKLDGVRH